MFHTLSSKDVLNELKIDPSKGLDDSSYIKSVNKFGKNQITKKKCRSLMGRIFDAICEPMMLILVFAWAVTFGINIGKFIKNGSGSFYECIGIAIAIGISVALTIIMEGRSKKAFDLLNKISDSAKVKVLRNGKIQFVLQTEIVVGDVVYIEAGDKIIADGRLIESYSLSIDESMLTGESKLVKKNSEVKLKNNAPLAERSNMVYSGTFVSSGNGVFVATAVGDSAEIGKIAADLLEKTKISAPLQQKLNKLGKMISIIGASSAVLVFCLSLFRLISLGQACFESVEDIFIEAIVLIVAAVPEGLPSTVAISLSLNVLKLAKSNALIRKIVATETIGSVSVICSDKTGTLTQNKMSVDSLVTKNGTFGEKNFRDKLVVLNCIINSSVDVINDEIKGSKTEAALFLAAKDNGYDCAKIRKNCKIISRMPFSSEKKYMETTAVYEGKTYSFVKGAPEIVIEKSNLSEQEKTSVLENVKKYQKQSKRVIAFLHKVEGNIVFDGFCALEDKIREDVVSAVKSCFTAGISVKMLTGDNLVTAVAIANKLGIGSGYGEVVCGEEIDNMSDKKLAVEIGKISVIARCTPKIKLRIVKALQSLGEVVAVTGDGVNDAPAIKNADIGIAMGDGSEITKEASDVVLLDNSFSTIIKAISFGRNIYCNFQRFITFQLTVNFSSMCIIIAFLIMGLESPFSSTCLLWLNVIMDGPLALSLGLEKATSSNLQQKPVKRTENILSFKIFARIAVHSIFIAFFCLFQQTTNFLKVPFIEKRTVTFALFVIFQLFNAINCREVRQESALKGIFGNKLLLITSVITFVLQIILTQYLPSLFGTTRICALSWVKIVCVCLSIVAFSEFYKAIYRFVVQNKNKVQAKNLFVKKINT